MITLIEAKTAAETSEAFTVKHNEVKTIVSNGLAGSEEVELEIEYLDDAFTAVYDRNDDVAIVFTATKNVIAINCPGVYRIVKPTTAGAASIGIHTTQADDSI